MLQYGVRERAEAVSAALHRRFRGLAPGRHCAEQVPGGGAAEQQSEMGKMSETFRLD
jgi:hypothetical protein